MTTAKKSIAKRTPPRTAKALPARTEPPIALDDMPELTPAQLARAVRRGPERFAKAFPVTSLETVRKGAGLTQQAVAAATGMTQGDVSRLEGRESIEGVRVETLRRYVEGLGGKLEIVATFPTGHRCGLKGAPRSADQSGEET